MTHKSHHYLVAAFILIILGSLCPGTMAQESPKSKILESRVSTSTPVEGEPFRYFLKFDYPENAPVAPREHFSGQGLTVLETRSMEPQVFQGRIIQQYEYQLTAPAGEYAFSPITLLYPGPLRDPVAAQAEPLQLTVVPLVEVAIESNSPAMLHDDVNVRVVITKRKPVTITALPHEFQAEFQRPDHGEMSPEPQSAGTPAPPPPIPPPLHFRLSESPQMTSQEQDGGTIDTYAYETLAAPQQPGIYAIPTFSIRYRTSDGEEREAHTPETTQIFVLYPNIENRDVPTDYRFLILPAIVIGVMLLAGVAVFMFLRFRTIRTSQQILAEPPLAPGEQAHKELAEIQAMGLPTRGEFKAYYSLVSEAVRKFLGAEFEFHVLERTTEEVMQEIHQRDIPPEIVEKTACFLREADMVKFAKYLPLLEEAQAAMQQALDIVDESVAYHQHRLMPQPEPQAMTDT